MSGLKSSASVLPSTLRLECVKVLSTRGRSRASLIFVHGVYQGAWAYRTTLLPFFAGLGYDGYALSLRGHGLSEGADLVKQAGFDDYLSDLRQVLATIKGPQVLIGHSLGGMLVQKHIEGAPVAGAVLVSTPAAHDLRWARMHALTTYSWTMLQVLFAGDPDRLFHSREKCRGLWFNGEHSVEIELALDQMAKQSESSRIFREMAQFKARPALGKIPLLAVGGESDPMVSVRSVAAQSRFHGGTFKTYPGRAHDLLMTPGWEEPARDIAAWLSQIELVSVLSNQSAQQVGKR